MRASSLAVLLGLTAVTVVSFVACVGDTPATSGNPGEEGQSCFSNGTCNAGLTCVSKVCVALDGGGDSGGNPDSGPKLDGGGPDGMPPPCPFTGTASSDTSLDCPPSACAVEGGLPQCCEQASGSACTNGTAPPCGGTGVLWGCDNPLQCASGSCCADFAAPLPGAACPKQTTISTQSTAKCLATCPPNNFELCLDDIDCSDPLRHCQAVQVTVGSTVKTVGMCL